MRNQAIHMFIYSTFHQVKKYAFTLAETLIVIGILGVVAALTLPNLNHATGDKETITKVKKIYSSLNEAFDRAQAVYGPLGEWKRITIDKWEYCDRNTVVERVTEFMKISKKCDLTDANDCVDTKLSLQYNFITTDGMSVAFFCHTDNVSIYVDLDGLNKGSSTAGKDVFLFDMLYNNSNDGVLANNYEYSLDKMLSDNCMMSQRSAAVLNCASNWILKYDNMDYTKLGDDGKCPDGNVPTEANPRCN